MALSFPVSGFMVFLGGDGYVVCLFLPFSVLVHIVDSPVVFAFPGPL